MVNYQNSKIYRIVSDQTDELYYGSTTQPLTARLSSHKTSYKCWQKGESRYCSSYEVMKYDDAKIILVEKYPCDTKEELHARERYFIENNTCTNKFIPGRTKKEYRENNKDKISEQKKEFYKDNKEKFQKKHSCPCGGRYTSKSMSKHCKTKRHQQYEESQAGHCTETTETSTSEDTDN